MKIKVCGMREPHNMAQIARLKPDYMGFIFYARSPRFVGSLPPEALDVLAPDIQRIGVFVDAPETYILDMAERYRLDGVQLHGSESPDLCAHLRQKHLVVKAFGVASEGDLRATVDYAGACDYFLFDTKTPAHGGSGQAFDHSILAAYTGDTPYFLSGGIGEADAASLREWHDDRCVGVDINSRFEHAPGVKDTEAVERFITKLRA
ncbi:MAG: phosphoribosylanthranilate isomerase [Rikenellaceae bacterium]|jgi:phosphoribosylanthranilate isomerase|nr:phosphoribosylanthranilate isomerase [Rikenellaceae bacterium]